MAKVASTGDVLTVVGVKTFEKRCDGCRHWESPDVPPIGKFDRLGFGVCRLTVNEDGATPPHGALAFAFDAEGYYANLRTKPEFSCVQWQAKEGVDA